MNKEEWIRLSEIEGVTDSMLGTVITEYYLLLFKGKKTQVEKIARQFSPGKYVYWKSERIGVQYYHSVLIEDKTTAMYAKLFADGQIIRSLRVGELATARNEIDIPWLPAIRGFLEIQRVNAVIEFNLAGLRNARRSLSGSPFGHLGEKLQEVIDELQSHQK